MRKTLWIQITLVVMTLLLLTAMSIGLSISGVLQRGGGESYLLTNKERAVYHLMVIVNGNNETYDDNFFSGIDQAADTYHIAAEIISLEGNQYVDEAIRTIERAVYAKADGIILHAVNSEALEKAISKAVGAEIPVILMNEDLAASGRISYVGVNRYKIGMEAAKALAKAMGQVGQVAVIDQRSDQGQSEVMEDLLLLGLTDELKNYEGMEIGLVKYTEEGVLSAETVATQIFKEETDIGGILCISGENTLGVAQAMIDNNMVGQMALIGFGDDEELLEYVSRGKIAQSTIVTDHQDIGSTSIETFYEYATGTFVSSYISTDLLVVDDSNLEAFLKVQEVEDGQK